MNIHSTMFALCLMVAVTVAAVSQALLTRYERETPRHYDTYYTCGEFAVTRFADHVTLVIQTEEYNE